MKFDTEGARKAGYSDTEIADHLAQSAKFDGAQARKAGYSDDDIIKHLTAQAPAAGSTPGKLASLGAGVGKGIGEVALGAQRYIGKGAQALGLDRAGQWLEQDATQGRAKLAAENKPYADANPITNAVGTVGGNVIATLPVGGALAAPLKAAAVFAPRLAPVADAVATAGMRAGGLTGKTAMATRMVGGGATGFGSAALVNENDAAVGGVIGAALPPGLKAAGAVGNAVGKATGFTINELRAVTQKSATTGARELLDILEITPDQIPALLAQLRGATTLVDGSTPTVAQALTSPQSAILQRVVAAGPGGEKLRLALQEHVEARMRSLHAVAPVDPNGLASAQTDFGVAAGRFANAERNMARGANTNQYKGVDPELTSETMLPVDRMKALADKYVGSGAVGENRTPFDFADEAARISKPPPAAPAGPQIVDINGKPFNIPTEPGASPANWEQVLRMRDSLGEQIGKAKDKGERQIVSALTQQKAALDDAVKQHLPPEMLARWNEANSSFAAMAKRFETGPQASIIATKKGEPAKTSSEITSLFWGNRKGMAEDVQAFRRLVDDNPAMLGQFRSMITTEGAAKANVGDDLGKKFVDWTSNMLPGLREAMPAKDVSTLQNIAKDVSRAMETAKRGAGPGSDTYQKASNALDAGLFGSPVAKMAAQKVPYVRAVAEPIRQSLAESASKAKGKRLADLLSNSSTAADAIEGLGLSAPQTKQLVRKYGGATLSDLLKNPDFRRVAYGSPAVVYADPENEK